MRPDEALEWAPAGDEIDGRSEHLAMMEDVDGERFDREQDLERSQAREASRRPPPRDTILRPGKASWITPVSRAGDRKVSGARGSRQTGPQGRDRREKERGEEQARRHGDEARSTDADREQDEAGERDPAGEKATAAAAGDRPARGAGDQGCSDGERLDVFAEADEVRQAGGAPLGGDDARDGESRRERDACRQDEVDEQPTRDPGESR